MPDIALSTDMIVGFPGETDADFEETLSLTAAVGYHSMFSFKYSPRPNTLADEAAAGRCAGGGEDAADRRAAGAAAARSRAALQRGGWSGATVDVLVDAASRRRDAELSGRTSGNTVVNLPGDRRRGSAGSCRCGSSGAGSEQRRGAQRAGLTAARLRRLA